MSAPNRARSFSPDPKRRRQGLLSDYLSDKGNEEPPNFARELAEAYPDDEGTLLQTIGNDPREPVRGEGFPADAISLTDLLKEPEPRIPREHLYEFLRDVDVNNRPWVGKGIDTEGVGPKKSFKSHDDPELMNFLKYVKQNPDASRDEVQAHLDQCTTQNCATNTFLGLSKMGAKTDRDKSPRTDLRDHMGERRANEKSGMDISEVLGIKDPDSGLNSNDDTQIPRGTSVFFQNRLKAKTNPFDHVFFAEQTGTNAEKIYRSLNAGQKSSELQSLNDVIKQGNYGGYNPIFSGKYRNFFQ